MTTFFMGCSGYVWVKILTLSPLKYRTLLQETIQKAPELWSKVIGLVQECFLTVTASNHYTRSSIYIKQTSLLGTTLFGLTLWSPSKILLLWEHVTKCWTQDQKVWYSIPTAGQVQQ